jgi:hypothetical protein
MSGGNSIAYCATRVGHGAKIDVPVSREMLASSP